MKRAQRGYTIVEVMLVLAVSGAILVAALLLFRGQQGRTAFDVSVHDVDSQINQSLKEVSKSISQFPDQYDCSYDPASGHVKVAPPNTTSQGGNKDCIILGLAFWPHEDKIDIYNVIGCRWTDCVANSSSTQDLAHTKPTTDTALLKQTYLIGSATVKSSSMTKSTGGTLSANLGGYYADLSTSGISGNSTVLQAVGYATVNNDSDVKNNIESNSTTAISQWNVCLQSDYDSSKTAMLEVDSSSKGVSTKLIFDSC